MTIIHCHLETLFIWAEGKGPRGGGALNECLLFFCTTTNFWTAVVKGGYFIIALDYHFLCSSTVLCLQLDATHHYAYYRSGARACLLTCNPCELGGSRKDDPTKYICHALDWGLALNSALWMRLG